MGSELRRWVPSEVISWQMIAFRCSSLTEWSRAGDDSYLRLTDSREINTAKPPVMHLLPPTRPPRFRQPQSPAPLAMERHEAIDEKLRQPPAGVLAAPARALDAALRARPRREDADTVHMHLAVLQLAAELQRALHVACVDRGVQAVRARVRQLEGLRVRVDEVDAGAGREGLVVDDAEGALGRVGKVDEEKGRRQSRCRRSRGPTGEELDASVAGFGQERLGFGGDAGVYGGADTGRFGFEGFDEKRFELGEDVTRQDDTVWQPLAGRRPRE
nr:hypothetical protein CFP56_21095 [Quercus suber]